MEISALELTAAYGDGYGSGYGSGSGYGYGSGYGDGYGYGYGDGSGSGDGSGYGYGYGDGDGYGYGYGDGSGYGYGDGDGYGYGYGYNTYTSAYLTLILAQHRAPPKAVLAFWRCHQDGSPSNGGSGTKAIEGSVEEINGPLKICTRFGLHGTLKPEDYKGEDWWIVALHEPIQTHGNKLASLKRTFIKHLGKCPF